jgi:hypothetical protein
VILFARVPHLNLAPHDKVGGGGPGHAN